MSRPSIPSLLLLCTLVTPSLALAGGRAAVTPNARVQWTETGIPGVRAAAVEGDMASGPSHFYLEYASGLTTPVHHHSPDHYVTTVSGNLTLIVDGAEHRLPPGSFFALTGAKSHVARCEAGAACVMFIDARDAWDVVPEPAATP